MTEAMTESVIRRPMPEDDLVRHLYSRRSLWGTSAVIYRRNHPMEWSRVVGNHQNWEVDTSSLRAPDAESRDGDPLKLFESEDMVLWVSHRRESMPFFSRNCNADELHLVSQGHMRYETEFGEIEVKERDFILIPKGVTYRVIMEEPQETLRVIYESRPEIFVVPTEMVDHVYGQGRPPLNPQRLRRPQLAHGSAPAGPFDVRVKYAGAFSEFIGDVTTVTYDFYPLDAEMIDGEPPVIVFSVADIEKLGSTPVPFVGGAYLDNKSNVAWMLHITGGGVGAPVHRNTDVDELRYHSSGPMMGNFLFSPQGVDHGAGRGYTRQERNRPESPYDTGDTLSLYTVKPMKGTALSYKVAKPYLC